VIDAVTEPSVEEPGTAEAPAVARVSAWRRWGSSSVVLDRFRLAILTYFGTRVLLVVVAVIEGAIRHHSLTSEIANWDGGWYRALATDGYRHDVQPRPDDDRVLPALPDGDVVGGAAAAAVRAFRSRRHDRRRFRDLDRRRAGGDRARTGPGWRLVGRVGRPPRGDPVLPVPRLGRVLDGVRGRADDPAGGRLHPGAAAPPLVARGRARSDRDRDRTRGGDPGPCLCVSAGLELRRRGWGDRQARRALIAPVLAPLGLIGVFAFLWAWTGNPLAYVVAQHDGWNEKFDPLALIRLAIRLVGQIHLSHFNHPTINMNWPVGLIGAVFLVILLVLMFRIRRTISPEAWVWTLGISFIALTSEWVPPNPRLLITAFPAVIVLAYYLKSKGYYRLLVVNGILLATMSAITFVGFTLRP